MVSHKKKLRSEKAKVKLKTTKLPKGLNVTKTEFKVRKIAIREQLKESQTTNQLNIKETISRLKHHSSKVRADALRNLREAIAANSIDMMGYMNNLIQSVSAISLDVDRDTRRDSYKALKSLLETLKMDEVLPFFHIFSSYLRCAMTHINPAIQEDSLLMLDVLLEHVPQLVVAHSVKIIQNFLEMISRVRKEGDHNRTLKVRLGQNQTTVKWRTKVLERLKHMLSTLVEYKTSNFVGKTTNNFTRIVTFNPNVPQHYSVKRPVIKQLIEIDVLAQMRPSLGSADDVLNVSEGGRLREYVAHLFPLLVESWIEVRPQKQTKCLMLSNEAAQTLKVALEIMQSLWQLMEVHDHLDNNKELCTWFQNEYTNAFANNFLTDGFPYQQTFGTNTDNKKLYKKHLKSLNLSGGQLCLEQNIGIAYLMFKFCKSDNLKQHVEKFTDLLKYLQEVISDLKTCTLQDDRLLIQTLQCCLFENGIYLLEMHRQLMMALLNSCIKAFLQNTFSSKTNAETDVLTLICHIVQSIKLKENYGEDTFQRFLEYLPQLLLKPSIRLSTLIAMSALAKQKNSIFLHSLEANISAALENIQKIQVVGAPNAFEGKKHILNLFYWTEKKLTCDNIDQLHQIVDNNITDKRISNYAKYILSS